MQKAIIESMKGILAFLYLLFKKYITRICPCQARGRELHGDLVEHTGTSSEASILMKNSKSLGNVSGGAIGDNVGQEILDIVNLNMLRYKRVANKILNDTRARRVSKARDTNTVSEAQAFLLKRSNSDDTSTVNMVSSDNESCFSVASSATQLSGQSLGAMYQLARSNNDCCTLTNKLENGSDVTPIEKLRIIARIMSNERRDRELEREILEDLMAARDGKETLLSHLINLYVSHTCNEGDESDDCKNILHANMENLIVLSIVNCGACNPLSADDAKALIDAIASYRKCKPVDILVSMAEKMRDMAHGSVTRDMCYNVTGGEIVFVLNRDYANDDSFFQEAWIDLLSCSLNLEAGAEDTNACYWCLIFLLISCIRMNNEEGARKEQILQKLHGLLYIVCCQSSKLLDVKPDAHCVSEEMGKYIMSVGKNNGASYIANIILALVNVSAMQAAIDQVTVAGNVDRVYKCFSGTYLQYVVNALIDEGGVYYCAKDYVVHRVLQVVRSTAVMQDNSVLPSIMLAEVASDIMGAGDDFLLELLRPLAQDMTIIARSSHEDVAKILFSYHSRIIGAGNQVTDVQQNINYDAAKCNNVLTDCSLANCGMVASV